MPRPLRPTRPLAASLSLTLFAAEGRALEPLSTFLRAARTHNPDAREARASADQLDAEADASLGALLPSASARGVFTRNQFEGVFDVPNPDGSTRKLVFQPLNQLDAYLTLSVPIVDLPGQARLRAARALAQSGAATASATFVAVEQQVTVAYFRVAGGMAMRAAAVSGVQAAEANATLIRDRRDAGAASALDMARGDAAVERAKTDLEEASLALELAARQLRDLSGVSASLDPPREAADAEPSLEPGPPLGDWLRGGDLASVRASDEAREAAEEVATAGRLAYAPTLSASFDQRFTNATGFVGRSSIYAATVTLGWQFDFATPARAAASASALRVAKRDRARAAAESQVTEQWLRVRSGIAKARAARAQRDASTLALGLARERYTLGTATHVELVSAQREAFEAQALVAQANAELLAARTLLRTLSSARLR
jgi:outer membrane protein TolC